MKHVLVATGLLISITAVAKNSDRVILKDSKTFETEVSTATVRCTQIGYSMPELKINLAALDGWTLFDHTNSQVGEFGEPCMTAGMCSENPTDGGFTIGDLIQNRPGKEVITVQREVIESKYESKDGQNQDVCERWLSENLQTKVRGIEFRHSRTGPAQIFPIEACRK